MATGPIETHLHRSFNWENGAPGHLRGPRGRSASCGNGLSAQCVRLRSEINHAHINSSISMNGTLLGLTDNPFDQLKYSSISMNGTPLGLSALASAIAFDTSISMNGSPLGLMPTANSIQAHSTISPNPKHLAKQMGSPKELPVAPRLGRIISRYRNSYPLSCSPRIPPQSSCSNSASVLFASQISSSDSPASCDSASPTDQP